MARADRQRTNRNRGELVAYWNLWLEQAQATNELDAHLYSHGVFEREPEDPVGPGDPAAGPNLAGLPAAARIDIATHVAAGGDAVLLDGDKLVLARGGGRREVVAALSEVPIAFGGAARYNVANALTAIGPAGALGVPVEAMARGLAAVRGDGGQGGADNPGRGCLMELDGFHVLLDYAHNPHGLAALLGFAASLPARRRLLLLGQAGDRDDEALRELARTAWRLRLDRVIVKELPTMLRGRQPREVPAILEAELLRLGARREDLAYAGTELEVVNQASTGRGRETCCCSSSTPTATRRWQCCGSAAAAAGSGWSWRGVRIAQ